MKNFLKVFVAVALTAILVTSCGKNGKKYVTNECQAREVIQRELTKNLAEDWSNQILDSCNLSDPTRDYLSDFKYVVMSFVCDSVEDITNFDGVKEMILAKDSAGLDVWDLEVFANSVYDYSGAATCLVERDNKNTFVCKRDGYADFRFKVLIDTDSTGRKSYSVEYLDN